MHFHTVPYNEHNNIYVLYSFDLLLGEKASLKSERQMYTYTSIRINLIIFN